MRGEMGTTESAIEQLGDTNEQRVEAVKDQLRIDAGRAALFGCWAECSTKLKATTLQVQSEFEKHGYDPAAVELWLGHGTYNVSEMCEFGFAVAVAKTTSSNRLRRCCGIWATTKRHLPVGS